MSLDENKTKKQLTDDQNYYESKIVVFPMNPTI